MNSKLLVFIMCLLIALSGVACSVKNASVEKFQRDFFVGTMWWQNALNQKTAEGKPAYWNNSIFSELNAKFASVIFRLRDEEIAKQINGGKKVSNMNVSGWVQPYKLAQAAIDSAQAGLEEAIAMGIMVLPSVNSLMFCSTAYEDLGLNPDDFYGKLANGKYPAYGTYKDCYLSCISNPNWINVMKDVSERFAKAGYCGIYFDLFPYGSGAGLLCHCDYCESRWAEESKKIFGKAKEIPITLSYTTGNVEQDAICMQFLLWRYKELQYFMDAAEKAGQKHNRNFYAYINSSVDNLSNQKLLLNGMYQMTSELHQLVLGNTSGLYLYRIAEALGERTPVWAHFNGPTQYSKGQYQTATLVAESYAGGGSTILFATNVEQRPYSIEHSKFLNENRNAYENTVSIAETAIFYSWEDHQFIQIGSHTNASGVGWDKNPARRVSETLAQAGIPFDYISYEKNEKNLLGALCSYKTVILPELKLVNDKMVKAFRNYVEQGGQLLVLGSSCGTHEYSKDEHVLISRAKAIDFNEWDKGDGKISQINNYLKSTNSPAMARATQELKNAFETFGMYDQVKVSENRKGFIESTIRSDIDENVYLNLINFGAGNSDSDYEDTPYHVSLSLPEDMLNGNISVKFDQLYVGKDFANDLIIEQCRIINGRLELHGNFSLYTLVTISKTDKPLTAIGPEKALTIEIKEESEIINVHVTGAKINPNSNMVHVTFDAPVDLEKGALTWYYIDTNGSVAGNENIFPVLQNAGPKIYGGKGYKSDYTWYATFNSDSSKAEIIPDGLILVVEVKKDKVYQLMLDGNNNPVYTNGNLGEDIRLYLNSTDKDTKATFAPGDK